VLIIELAKYFMYQLQYKLKRRAFRNSVNTHFFFNGGDRGLVLETVIFNILNGERVIKINGELGSGKSMVCQLLQKKFPDTVRIAKFTKKDSSNNSILNFIANDIELSSSKKISHKNLLGKIHNKLQEINQNGSQYVLLIDDANCLAQSDLNEIRDILTMNKDGAILFQNIIFSSTEFDKNLARRENKELTQFISSEFRLRRLNSDEIADYLQHRLSCAGNEKLKIFSDEVVQKIHSFSNGVIGIVNAIAEKSLHIAYSESDYNISVKHVELANRQLFGESGQKSGVTKNKFKMVAISLIGLFGLILIPIAVLEKNKNSKSENRVTESKSFDSVLKTLDLTKQNSIVTSDNSLQNNLANSKNNSQSQIANNPESDIQSGKNKNINISDKIRSVQKEDKIYVTSIEKSIEEEKDPVLRRIKATNRWLETSDEQVYTIQLMTSSAEHVKQLYKIRRILRSKNIKPQLDNIFIYRGKEDKKTLYVVSYSSFSSISEATKAIKKLPKQLRRYKPFIRSIHSLQKEMRLQASDQIRKNIG